MKTSQKIALITSVWALLLLSAGAALADPPSRAIRLKYMSGEVSMQPGGVNDWVAATLNRPLTTADRLWTDKNSRAELSLGSASLRLNAETSMTLTNVTDEIVQVELDQGTLNLHIRHLFDGETYEIDTPNQAFTILKGGDYRFDVDPNADTTYVTVWHGEGESNGQGPGVKLHSGEQASFQNGTSLEHQTYPAPDRDGFDDWCKVRSDREDHAQSYRYVSADVVGADDLDDYGSWRAAGSYGTVWVPAVAPGWAPYRYGHWVWVAPWGWTWVDDAPWGFAPCHYGRWVYYDGFWGWAPGPVVVARPVYAPALVAWVGGPHIGVSISVGGGAGVGWFPLGWGEPYVPAYHVSRNYFQQVNVTNTHITNITNVTNNYYVTNNNTTVIRNTNVTNIHYVNQNVSGAVTAVPNRVLTNSEPVARSMVAVNASQMKTVQVASAAPVAPERNSVLGVNAGARTAAPPERIASRPVVSRVAPPVRPVPFAAQQEALGRNPGRPLDAKAEANIRSNLPPAPMRTAGQPAAPAQPGAPSQPGRPGMPANNPANVTARPVPSTNPAPRPGVPSPGMNAATPQPTVPTRMVPRPPQPGSVAGTENPRNVGERPEVSTPRNQPVSTAPPVTAAPVRNVPRPPQAGGMNNSETQPRQPVRYPDPEASRPSTNMPRPNPTPVPSNPGNVDRGTPAPRAPESPGSWQRQPSHNDNTARPENQPRANLETRPQAPRPIYDPHTVREEQRPQSRPQPQPQPQPQTHHESSPHKDTR